MTVRQSLLAILDQGPCYGYQLRSEFARRTGSTWPLNVGQIYNTLERLERDGLARKGQVDEHGHVFYEITDAGSADVRAWLDSPVVRQAGTRDELPVKLALAATLPGVDAREILRTQRAASLARRDELRRTQRESAAPDGPEELAASLVLDAQAFEAEAELRFLEHAAERLARHPQRALALELSSERPRRGRPARAESSAGASEVADLSPATASALS
jgi:DNA-binding PadR family transcriptional regulator